MSEEQKESIEEKEKDKSEKLIYVLTGLLVIVIFGAIAVLYFNPSNNEKIYKPEKIQIAESKLPTEKPNKELNKSNVSPTEVNKTETLQTNTELNKPTEANKIEEEPKESVKEQNVSTEESKAVVKEEEKKEERLAEEQNKNVVKKEKQKSEEKPKPEVKKEVKKEEPKKEEETKKKTEVVKTNKEEKRKTEKKVVKHVKPKKVYFIQVAALASMEKAQEEKANYERRGFKNLFIIKEKGMYKLLIGKFYSMKEALEYKKKHNLKEGWIRIFKSDQL